MKEVIVIVILLFLCSGTWAIYTTYRYKKLQGQTIQTETLYADLQEIKERRIDALDDSDADRRKWMREHGKVRPS